MSIQEEKKSLKEKLDGFREITAQMEAEYATPKRREEGTKVSVIIPVHNAEKTLSDAVLSVKSQSYTDLEILLVEDGSQDESAAICDHLAATDDRIRVFHGEKQGVSAARNKGLSAAAGTYVMFVDADDVLLPGAVRTLMEAEKSYRTDMVCMRHRVVKTREVISESRDYTGGSAQQVSGYYFFDYCLLEQDTHVWGKLFYRPALQEITFDEDLTIGEDMLFLEALCLRFQSKQRITLLPDTGYAYTESADGAMNRPFVPSFADNMTCWLRCEERLADHRRQLSPYALTNLHVIQIMNALIVAGKIALLPADEWDAHEAVIRKARDIVKQNIRRAGVFAALSNGYKGKALYFHMSPERYLKAYAAHKGRGG